MRPIQFVFSVVFFALTVYGAFGSLDISHKFVGLLIFHLNDRFYRCTISLVRTPNTNTLFGLTSAHCVDGADWMILVLGDELVLGNWFEAVRNYPHYPTTMEQVYRVDAWYPHWSYTDMSIDENDRNDVGIVLLDELSRYQIDEIDYYLDSVYGTLAAINSVPLIWAEDNPEWESQVSGYGILHHLQDRFGQWVGHYQWPRRVTTLNINKYESRYTDTSIVVSQNAKDGDHCLGGSGAPMFISDDSNAIVAVMSLTHSTDTCLSSGSSARCDVDDVRDWINSCVEDEIGCEM